jgi:protein-S-isoprenylcysteine O-methyltransferase Ste14
VSGGGRSRAVLVAGTALFVLLLPLQVAGTVPWMLSRWRVGPPLLGFAGFRWLGAALVLAGLPVLGATIVRFVRQGRGVPAPVLPAQRLVVTGLYRHVRNPMYIAVVGVIVGQGLVFGSPPVLRYAAAVAVGFHLFVLLHEEPSLRSRFGAEYEAYCRAVPRWRPRLTPWTGGTPQR